MKKPFLIFLLRNWAEISDLVCVLIRQNGLLYGIRIAKTFPNLFGSTDYDSTTFFIVSSDLGENLYSANLIFFHKNKSNKYILVIFLRFMQPFPLTATPICNPGVS